MKPFLFAIYAVMVILTVASALAADLEYTATVNSSSLPFGANYSLALTLAPNQTVFLSRTDNESRINVSFPNATFLNETNTTNITIAIMVPAYNVTLNESLIAGLNITNTLNNLTFSWMANITVLADNGTNASNGTPSLVVRVINGDYVVNITSNLLPIEGNLSYEVQGPAGGLLNISCPGDSYLSCPNQTVFEADNVSRFSIRYRIPITQPDGIVLYTVNLSSENTTRQSNITFVITEPDINQMTFVFREDCFVEVPGENYSTVKYDCILEQEEFNLRRLAQFLERIKALRNSSAYCSPEIINESKTEYVVAGQVDKVIVDNYEACTAEKTKLQASYDTTTELLHSCQEQRGVCQDMLSKNETDAMLEAFAYKEKARRESEASREYYNKRFWKWIGYEVVIVIILFIIGVWYTNYHRNKWGAM
jgi:hypothetical protein